MNPRYVAILAIALLSACNPAVQNPDDPVTVTVNPALVPGTATTPGPGGETLRVAASRDAKGIQTDFVEGIVLVRASSRDELKPFLDRYQGVVLGDDTIPEPPPELGITLTPEQRKPTEFIVRINLATVDTSAFEINATVAGLTGMLEFSSESGFQTLAGVADAVAAGFDASPDYVDYKQQFPAPLLSTEERSNGAGGWNDALTTARFAETGSESRVALAWQFVSAHGIERRTRVAIIDEGFWLNPNGTPRGSDSDLPANPAQYDFLNDDYFADGPAVIGCGAGNPCYWHGTGAAGVATGILNNRLGAAGTGGLIADPILLRRSNTRSSANRAIRTAVAWGADVVSMSFGGDCNQACRIYDREHTPIDDAVDAGSRTVFLAAAGNGRAQPDGTFVGYDVGDPAFVHPCIVDHVICVGALANNSTMKIGYSNFGDRVNIFAPTNIPVMSYPNSFDAANNPLPPASASGPEMPQNFSGTSASTPFVAGVVAMMKAVNPDLTSDQVAALLAETAHPGVAPVTRYIDAYAAVRRAAQDRPAVLDRYDVANVQTVNLGTAASYTELNLGLHTSGDRDFFEFTAPGKSSMMVDVEYPTGLGTIALAELEALGDCGEVSFVREEPLARGGRRFVYTVPGGGLKLGLRADDVNAYNLNITFAGASVPADSYETNDTPATARWLRSYTPSGSGGGVLDAIRINPRVVIDATIHSATDVDYYIVRGVRMNTAELVYLNAFPAVSISSNESSIGLDVWRLNEDGTQGASVGSVRADSCEKGGLTVGLDTDVYYLVRVSGAIGRYTLHNGVRGSKRNLPILVQDPFYDVLKPGDPVERIVRGRGLYVLPPTRSFAQLRASGNVRAVRLFDFDGALVFEPSPMAGIFTVDLGALARDRVYALEVEPDLLANESPRLTMAWDPVVPLRLSENLVRNGGAEEGENGLSNWGVPSDDLAMPEVIAYTDGDNGPHFQGPGPADRGFRLFAGGASGQTAGIQQAIAIDPSWRSAVDAGRVECRFGAFLGGLGDEPDYATVTVTFLDERFRPLGTAVLDSITSVEREGLTGLLPASAVETVPAGTVRMEIDMVFYPGNAGVTNAYVDNVELRLAEFAD